MKTETKQNTLVKFGVTKPYTVFVMIMVVVILGFYSFNTFKMELFPNMNLPYVLLMADSQGTWTDNDPDTTHQTDDEYAAEVLRATQEYTARIETILRSWPGLNIKNLQSITSTSYNSQNRLVSQSVVVIEFVYGTNTGYASGKVERALGMIDNTNPFSQPFSTSKNIHIPNNEIRFAKSRILELSPDLLPIYQFTTDYKRTATLPANVTSNPTYIALDDETKGAIQSFIDDQATLEFMKETVAEQIAGAGGVGQMQSSVYLVEITEAMKSANPQLGQLQSIGILGDALYVNAGFTLVNGKSAYSFSAMKEGTAVTTEVVKNITAKIREINRENAGFSATVNEVQNQGEYITSSVKDVIFNLVLGGILAVVILFLFMRSWKMTLAVTIAIPFSVVGTFVLMYFMGIGLNIVSMSGLALVVGLLIDNSVVVAENVFRMRQLGLPIRDACIRGASQIFIAVVASTITTICVFFPMFFVTGLIMDIFMELVWVVILSICASLFVALACLPAIIASFKIGDKVTHKKWRFLNSVNGSFEKMDNWFVRVFKKPVGAIKYAFDRAVRFTIKNKWAVCGLTIVLFVGSIGLIFINGFEMMPATDSGEFGVTVEFTNDGLNSIELNNAILTAAENIYDDLFAARTGIARDVDTASVGYSLGGSILTMGANSNPRLDINIKLNDRRDISTNRAMENIYNAVRDYARVSANLPDGLGFADISTSGNDMTSSMVASGVSVEISAPDNTRLGTALEYIKGELDTRFKRDDGTYKDGISKITVGFDAARITRLNNRIVSTIDIKLVDGASVSKVQTLVDDEVNYIFAHKPAGGELENIGHTNTGFAEQFNETFVQLFLALIIGLLLVYLVMVAIFQSFKLPLIVLLTVPLGFTGGFALLSVCGLAMSVPAVIGFIVLMGVITNNGIILIDYINTARREEGDTIVDASVKSAKVRARPILITSVSTIFALIPSAMGFGASGGMMQPIAIACIGGLCYATFMSLLVVPAFYNIMYFVKVRREKKGEIGDVNNSKLENEQNPRTIA